MAPKIRTTWFFQRRRPHRASIFDEAHNQQEAAYWYNLAAQQNDPEAQYALSLHYWKTDKAEAIRWLDAAAGKGYRPAEDSQAKSYASDQLGRKDIDKAASLLYRIAAKYQDVEAYSSLFLFL